MSGVAIAGATGLVGTALAASCARDGIRVSALVRDVARAAELLPAATLHAWDATRGSPPEAAFEGVDVVVNLAGEPISGGRWTEARKKLLRDSRVVGTRALVDALRGLRDRPKLLISAS
ncbi:MAG TPA: NAD-dependent epimerase/dehydratase family protein, partial [Polyangia bacterium]|nr:NAD-dependent epimerase/dehydratase family protein [Polyangia bacterium]